MTKLGECLDCGCDQHPRRHSHRIECRDCRWEEIMARVKPNPTEELADALEQPHAD